MACNPFFRRGKIFYRIHFDNRTVQQKAFDVDNHLNRKMAEGRAAEITSKIRNHTFDYAVEFPEGNHYSRVKKPKPAKPHSVRSYYEKWIERQVGRASKIRDYKQHYNAYILPQLGDLMLSQIDQETLEDFRSYLLKKKKLSMKSARNCIGGSLRAMLRDAKALSGFENMSWPRLQREQPDPFTEDERDKILAHYRKTRPFKDYAFVAWQFYQGCRPSESSALRWGNVDVKKAKARISTSRHLGEEAATKTAASDRTIDLMPPSSEILRQIKPVHEKPDAYVFVNEQGLPIDAAEFGRAFQGVLRVLELRQRRFYCSRHTWISLALTADIPVKYIAEQAGTSIQMIQANYGKFMGDSGAAKLKALYVHSRPNRDIAVTSA